MSAALPLSLQLVLTFVGLLVGMTAVLTTAAHSSLLRTLETDARASVAAATRAREQAVTQLFQLRQQRAEGFLGSVRSFCAEPLDNGRFGWVVDECVRTMVDDFRKAERAPGALLTYGTRRLRRSGQRIIGDPPAAGTMARIVAGKDGAIGYVMKVSLGDLALTLQFDHEDVAKLFPQAPGIARSGEVSLIDYDGHILAPAQTPTALPVDRADFFRQRCREGGDDFVGADYLGIDAIQSVRPIAVLGTACVAARIGYAEALAPAELLRRDLMMRGLWFVLVGAVLSLLAAQWIAAPVRRLALSARNLKSGRFDRPISLAGPSETRELGRAFNVMANDLAEMVAKEQAARRQAEAANRSKDDFLATVSHELRTPLTAILGWAHILRSERLPQDRVAHAMEVIERAARVQRQLIDDLLDVSRIVSNRLQIMREPVRFADVIEAALDAVRPQAETQRIEIETELTASAIVLGDARRLEQVVWNLAWNAVKFTQEGGRISVKLSEADRQAVLSITDTGVGIASAFLPHIFDWFRQSEARPRSQSGLGLGLGIVRHIVRLHGGSVRAESRGEGQGATFVVTLPVHVPTGTLSPAAPRTVTPAVTIGQRLNAVRVLVVEDDDDTREMVRVTLENAGASVEAVASADEARREMLGDAPDVLISDIRMPEEDGYSLIRSLRKAGVATPAIALTAFARKEDAEEARAAGFQTHLAKPVDSAGLIDAVATLVVNHTVH